MTCILGRNGVGKTSLLRAIFGLQSIRVGPHNLGRSRIDSVGGASARPRRLGTGAARPRDFCQAERAGEP